MNDRLIQVSREGTSVNASTAEIRTAAAQFAAAGVLKLRSFLDPHLRDVLLDLVDRADFARRIHDGIGTELCALPGLASGTLELLMNDAALHAAIAALTQADHIGCFEGRIYRLVPGTDHHDSWHSDVGDDRLVAMSVNLSRGSTEGGTLEIRRASSPEVISQMTNPTPGDAVIFRIDPTLRHRVSAVTGGAPRTAYAGWFRRSPDFSALVRPQYSAHPS